MNLYTLDVNFKRQEVLDEFSSFIWTERYGSAGDVNLVVPATPLLINRLAAGTFLSVQGSNEVMIIDTQSVDKGLLTIKGDSLLKFLNERMYRSNVSTKDRSVVFASNPIGFTMGNLVTITAINVQAALGGANNNIPNLTLGAIDTSGESVSLAVPFGAVYDILKTWAETYALGMSLYLDVVTSSGYSLKFTVYKGLDRTSSQTVRPLVRFSPALDSLTNIKELRSIDGYKTVAYVYSPTPPNMGTSYIQTVYVPGGASLTGFNQRALILYADDLTDDVVSGPAVTVYNILTERGKNALANNNFVKLVDGEVLPQSEFQFGVHYGLGDIVELEGHSGQTQKARITEYTRSEDETGERAYPTVSVID